MADILTSFKIQRHIGRLGHANPAARQAASAALQSIGTPAVGPLCVALLDRDPLRSAGAAAVLGRLRDPHAVEPLLTALNREQALEVVVTALGDIGHPAAIRPLVAMFQKRYLHLAEPVAQALVKIGAAARESLAAVLADRNQDDVARYWSAVVLARLGWQPYKDALGVAYWVQMQDWDRCAQMGTQAFDLLDAELRAGIPPASRQSIIGVLARIGGARAVESIAGLLQDADSGVRRTAVDALATLGGPRVAEALAVALQDPDADVRRTAVQSLIRLGDARTVELVQGALLAGDGGVRLAAVEVLSQVVDPRALDSLARAVKDNDEQVRLAVVHALGRKNDPRAVAGLGVAVKDNSLAVRRAAVETLSGRDDVQSVEMLAPAVKDNDTALRKTAVTALSRSKETRAIEAVAAATRDNDKDVRLIAFEALGTSTHPRATDMLAAAIKDGDATVRQAAAAALLKRNDPNATALLAALLKDAKEAVRRAAVETLGKTGDARAAQLLLPALNDLDSRVREAAVNALAALKWQPTPDDAGVTYLIMRGQFNDLIPLGAAAVEPLIAELKRLGTGYSGKSARKTIVTVLGKLGDRRAIPALQETERRDGSPGVCRRARRSLGWLKA